MHSGLQGAGAPYATRTLPVHYPRSSMTSQSIISIYLLVLARPRQPWLCVPCLPPSLPKPKPRLPFWFLSQVGEGVGVGVGVGEGVGEGQQELAWPGLAGAGDPSSLTVTPVLCAKQVSLSRCRTDEPVPYAKPTLPVSLPCLLGLYLQNLGHTST